VARRHVRGDWHFLEQGAGLLTGAHPLSLYAHAPSIQIGPLALIVARPLVGAATIDRVVTAVRAGRSVVAALPVVDTLKDVDADGRIVATVSRETLWRAQTPQGFPRQVIVNAHRRARAERVSATDDAALLERLGIPVHVVRGSERALKVTEPGDFARVDALLANDE